MTSRLSHLQKAILAMAMANRQKGESIQFQGQPMKLTDLYYAEVLAMYFGFAKHMRVSRAGIAWDVRHRHGQHFDRKAIGAKRYAAAQASLSRAVRRLEQRGLIECVSGAFSRWSGLNLTETGIEAAKNDSVNTEEIVPQC